VPEATYRPAALDDLDEIWRYTVEEWNEEQAEKYVHQVAAHCHALASGRRLGVACDYVRQDYHKSIINKHVVYYRNSKTGVEIVRILHEHMDVDRQLGDGD
jgi:toxin ParE1/3/4